jgi:hypothetical protein
MSQPMAMFIDERKPELVAYCSAKAESSWPGIDPAAHQQVVAAFLDHLRASLRDDAGEPFRVGEGGVPGAERHGYLTFLSDSDVSTISRDFGTVCDAVCELAAQSGITFPVRDFQTMNAVVDTAIAAAIREFLRARRELDTARSASTGQQLEIRNAISAARVSFDALREGLVGMRSHTADVLNMAIERLERLSTPE